MLSEPRPQTRRIRPQSLRQEYEGFVLQRIEEYKDHLSRRELLRIADEAVHELEGPEEQLLLTEVLLLEHVDRLIMRRLKLPSFGRWRQRHLNLRQTQQQPEHWSLPHDTPLDGLARRLEDGDTAIVIGERVAPAALYLAAHQWPVVFIDASLPVVEAVEERASREALGSGLQSLVVRVEHWFPTISSSLAVIDPQVLQHLDVVTQATVVDEIKQSTLRGGLHCVLDTSDPSGALLESLSLHRFYQGWVLQSGTGGMMASWVLATKP